MRVLAVGDIHIPAEHPGYLKFCWDIYEYWECDKVVLIGDVVDHHAISAHASEHDAATAADEYKLARDRIAEWQDYFPKALVCIGNHDIRVERMALSAGVPPQFIRSFKDTWETPNWEWDFEHYIDGVRYFHGTGMSGQQPALRAAIATMTSTVCGHVHSQAGVAWSAAPGPMKNGKPQKGKSVFGLTTGCGVDISHPAARYGANMLRRPVLGCGVVLGGTHAYFERMAI